MEGILSLIVLVLLVLGLYKLYNLSHLPEDQLNFIRAEEELEEINKKKTALRTLEYLITDIDVCSSSDGLYKFFTLSWLNEATGENLEYQFFIYDNKSSMADAVKTLANIEKARIRPEFQECLDKVGIRSRKAAHKRTDIKIHNHNDVL